MTHTHTHKGRQTDRWTDRQRQKETRVSQLPRFLDWSTVNSRTISIGPEIPGSDREGQVCFEPSSWHIFLDVREGKGDRRCPEYAACLGVRHDSQEAFKGPVREGRCPDSLACFGHPWDYSIVWLFVLTFSPSQDTA